MSLSTFEFYIYKPQAATNLITNPSFEIGVTSWDGHFATGSVSQTEQRRGAQSMAVAVTSDVESGVYYTAALADATEYTFSADVLTVTGLTYLMYISTTADVLVSTQTSWTGNGHWQRRAVTYTTTAATNYKLMITRSTDASTDSFYVDGCQLEVGGETTFFDGSYTGFVVGQTDFGWNGTAHASTSWRSGQTRKGGTRVRLKDSLPAITVIGLGMPPIINQAQPHTLGGSYFQNTIAADRAFSILGELNGTTPGAFLTLRDTLIDAVNHNQTAVPQPLVLEWRGLDRDGVEAAETCLIECHYSGGLEGNWEEFGYEQIPLQFQAFSPYIYADGDHSTVLNYTTTVDSVHDILYRDTDGQWKAMGTGVSTDSASDAVVRAIVTASDGSVYAGGYFSEMGGVANTSNIAKWNGSAWSALGTGTNGEVVSLIIGPDGALYAGGAFTLAGGVADTVSIAKWNGSVWTALSSGCNDIVYGLAFGQDGYLYAGGSFTLASGVADTAYIAKWSGSAWTPLSTGMDTSVVDLAVGLDGTLYAGGSFTSAGSTACARIAKWDGTDWSPLGSGADGSVAGLAVGPDGSLYAGGLFATMGGVTGTSYIAKWNGSAWSALGSGLNSNAYSLKFDANGDLYVAGYFTSAGGVTMPDRVARWNGASWLPLDVNVQDTAAFVYDLALDARGRLYMGGKWAGSAALSATVTTPNVGSANAYPRIYAIGPGKIWQIKNYTTGRSIYFNDLTLLAGETLTLDLTPERILFLSSWRGNLMNYILPGSNLDFPLAPGDNNISAYMTGTTAASTIFMMYKDRFLSLDGAVY